LHIFSSGFFGTTAIEGSIMSTFSDRSPPRIGVIGSGFVASHFVRELMRRPGYRLSKILTRRKIDQCRDFPYFEALVNNLDTLIEESDVVFECTGDPYFAASTLGEILDAGIPVVTLNSEFHSTIGSHFVSRGVLSEADGDQPGCLASLYEDAVAMGFDPLVCANMKAFLNLDPTPDDMAYWAKKQRFSLEMVTSFTDGTKLQIEQCLVANGLGLDIVKQGLVGINASDLNTAATEFGHIAERHGAPISDFILDRAAHHGVFIVARHDDYQETALRNYKMGDGPYYLLVKDYCLVHLEVFKTIERLLQTGRPLLNNGRFPQIGVASVAKRDLSPGESIKRGAGGFDLRGECVRIRDERYHVPICLANEMRVRRRIERGQLLSMDDVDLPESAALAAWFAIRERSSCTTADPKSADDNFGSNRRMSLDETVAASGSESKHATSGV
jgi:predicted homoserine dehydrogenase-like protein